MLDRFRPAWLFPRHKTDDRARRARRAAKPTVEGLEAICLLAIADIEPNDSRGIARDTGLTADAPGTDSGMGNIALSALDREDWYKFSVPLAETADFTVTLKPTLFDSRGFELIVSNYNFPGYRYLYDSSFSNRTLELSHTHVPGDASIYYIGIRSNRQFDPTDEPYQLTITTGFDRRMMLLTCGC